MSDIKQDVKEIVKVFIRTFVSIVVKESTKKLIKSLTQIQRKMLEARVKNMSDDQLEQYFEKDPYFKNELENTVKSINCIQPAEGSGSWLENIQLVCEASCIQNLIKVLIQQVTKMTLVVVACVALLAVIAVPMVIGGENHNPENPIPPDIRSIDPKIDETTVSKHTEMPVANFSSNVTNGYVSLSVQFTDLSKNATEWNWDFGDGEHSIEQNSTHTYYTAGNYTVTLTVTNGKVADSKTAIITVLEQPVLPVANFSSNTERYYALFSVQFTDLSEHATEWNWDFGDGTNSTEQDPAHTYSFKGNYTVNLTAINTNGTDSKLALIKVLKRPEPMPEPIPEPIPEPVLPAANFSSNVTSGYTPLSVQFTDLSEDATGWNWDFGDGATSTGQNPVHTYSSAGNYTVFLTVSNANGTDSKPATITVLQHLVYAYVTNRGDNTVSVINASDNTTYTVNVGSNPYGVAVSPDGTKIYVANRGDNTVSVINASDNTTYTVNVGSNPWGIAVSSDGTKVYVTNSGDNNVSVINVSDNTTYTVSVGDWPRGIAVSPDGTKVYVANYWDGTVSVINASDNTTYAVNIGSSLWGVAVSPDGTNIYVTNYWSNTVSIINASDNTTYPVNVVNHPSGIAVSPDGTKVYVTETELDEISISGNVSIIDTATNNVTATVNVGTDIFEIAVTPDGTKVYVTVTKDGIDSVSIIDTTTNNVTATVRVGNSPYGVAIVQK
jgi:YVTN family beta-propeller protein